MSVCSCGPVTTLDSRHESLLDLCNIAPLDERTLLHLLNKLYPQIDNVYANYQPIFLIDQMISICEFEGIPLQMNPEMMDRAWANMFVKEEEIIR
jgi:hypothetical protein